MPDEYIRREAARRMVNQLPRYTWSSPVSTDYCVAVRKDEVLLGLDRIPAADVAEVVRCKDCIYNIDGLCFCRRPLGSGVAVGPDDFCRWGEAE